MLCVGLFDLSILIGEAKNVGALTEIHLCVNPVYVYLAAYSNVDLLLKEIIRGVISNLLLTKPTQEEKRSTGK